MKDYLDIDNTGQTKFKVSNTPKLDYLIKEKRFDDALNEVNRLLKSDSSSMNWNFKGIILQNMSKYSEAIECFDNALGFDDSGDAILNQAECYYNWAKVTFFPEGDCEKALSLVNLALDIVPDNVDASEYYFLKAEIFEGLDELVEAQKCYLTAYKEFDKLKELESQIDYLASTSDTLVNIVGGGFYDFTPVNGMTVGLVKESDNEHDPDAIAVVVDGETVGYVANNPYTLIDEVRSASDVRSLVGDNQKAEILFVYLGEYVIARLL